MGQEIEISAADSGRFAGYLALPRTVPAPGLIVLPEVYNTNPYIPRPPTVMRMTGSWSSRPTSIGARNQAAIYHIHYHCHCRCLHVPLLQHAV